MVIDGNTICYQFTSWGHLIQTIKNSVSSWLKMPRFGDRSYQVLAFGEEEKMKTIAFAIRSVDPSLFGRLILRYSLS